MNLASDSRLCDIVIPIWNQLLLTRRCLDSVLASTEEPIQLILIDNASKSPTREYLDYFKELSPVPVKIIRNTTNLGFIKGVNQGIQAAQASWICILNNDTIATPGWLTEMLKVASSDPQIGLVNPTSNSLGFHPGKIPLETYTKNLKIFSGQWTELSTALGFCLLARRSLFDSVGLLDESFGMGNFDDDDLSLRVKKAGLRCVRACASYVFHEEKASFRFLPGWKSHFEYNRRLFEQRWGRRLRILAPHLPSETALALLEKGHWLTLSAPGGDLSPRVASHAQVDFLGGEAGWRWRATLRLLWKRRKPFNLVISSDRSWSRWLKILRWFHCAQILDQPSHEEIFQQCQKLSRCPSL